jgi:hypothetical protein
MIKQKIFGAFWMMIGFLVIALNTNHLSHPKSWLEFAVAIFWGLLGAAALSDGYEKWRAAK